LKSVKVFLFILIGSGDTREVKGEVSFLEGLLSSVQSLINPLFLGNLTGEEKKNG
jgi:hypothetical protein